MTRRRIVEGLAVLIAMMAGTWFAGWWMVPIVAVIAGAAAIAPVLVATTAALAWALFLIADAAQGPLGRIMTMLGGVMGLPGVVVVMLTILFPALLAWSAATLGTLVSSAQPQPESIHHPD
jgi:hypothetical protein